MTSTKKRLVSMQAQLEGQAAQMDVLISPITASQTAEAEENKNNYKSYDAQVAQTYKMYDALADYGSEILRGIVESRVSFISGEGISVDGPKPTMKFIDKFLYLNKLRGSRLLSMVQTGEMEGKNLVILSPDRKPKLYKNEIIPGYVKARSFSWYVNKYVVQVNQFDTDEITKITYADKTDEKKVKSIPIKQAVYIRLGGSPDKLNDTPSRIHNVLTQIENASRIELDLRKNNHLFAKIMPTWKTTTPTEAKGIRDDVNSDNWELGKSYAGTADFSLTGPPLGASDALSTEFVLCLKIISAMTGIPIHWMAYPELMSNRATAENLLEVVHGATVKDRLIWEEGLKDIILKAMDLAIAEGWEDNSIKKDFVLKFDMVSLATLKALSETWLPLQMANVISMSTLRSKVPGIDSNEEKQLIEKEKKENVELMQDSMAAMNGGVDVSEENKGTNDDTGANSGKQTGSTGNGQVP